MLSPVPKQYLPLLGKPILLHALKRLCSHPRVQGAVVGIAQNDLHWQQIAPELGHLSKFLGTSPGGATRAQTVLNGLMTLKSHAKENDWVMVHDAVRPCVRREDIDKLIAAVIAGEEGGLLGFPVSDTVKRVNSNDRVTETVRRRDLWRAATPQMFRIGQLAKALEQALKSGKEITDEASAMELSGGRPQMIAGHTDNIKITLPEDLELAEYFLQRQENS